MRRALAVLGALALVVVAVIVRGLIDGADGADDPAGDGQTVVVCDPDFESYCEALPGAVVRIEHSEATSAAIVEGSVDGVDAWVTTDAWFELTANRAEGGAGTAEAVASSPVVAAVDPARVGALQELCEGTAVLRCLGDHAGRPWADLGGSAGWGALKTGLPDADRAIGLSTIAAIAIGDFGSAEVTRNDFDSTGLRGRLAVLAEPSRRGDPDPAATLVARRGQYSAAASVAAVVDRITRPVESIVATPAVHATVVLVDLPASDRPPTAEPLRDALVAHGWAPASGPPAAVLKPGVMGALHDLWKDVTR